MKHRIQGALLMMALFAASCARPAQGAEDLPKPERDLPAAAEGETRTAVLAGGCFWCTEAVFQQLDGVKEVISGYAGDTQDKANYKAVSTGETKHAEAIKITYDPSKVSYGRLLQVFFATHDPTTKDRQGPDYGPQYRSAIFYESEQQKQVAESYIKQLTEAKAFDKPIVTTLEPLTGFYPAEEYHQDFAQQNPEHPYIIQNALPKVKKAIEKFVEQAGKDKPSKDQ